MQRRPTSLLALLLLALGCTAGTAPGTAAPAALSAAQPIALATTVFIVRHAEKASDDPRDPRLSAAGEARARALADLLGQAGVTHLFATEYRRTQDTLRPLATATGREITVVSTSDREALLAAIQALPGGSVAVVAGHSNTIPVVVRALGGEVRGPLSEDTYDRLFMLTLSPARPGSAQTMELRLAPGAP